MGGLVMSVAFPIFVREKDSGRVFVCSSVYELQYHTERIDIENNEYDAWDSKGTLVNISVQDPIWIRLEAASSDDQGLRDAIRGYASQRGMKLDETLLNQGNYIEATKDLVRK
jgi:hypothetical protein